MPENVTVDDGNPVNVTCRARGSPAPSFTRYIGGKEALPSQVSSSSSGDVPDFIYTVSTLSITSATPEDSNIYTCVASNTIYGVQVNDSQRYTLTVNCKGNIHFFIFKFLVLVYNLIYHLSGIYVYMKHMYMYLCSDTPSIISPPVGVQAVYGDVVKLNCTAEGFPVPTITWLMESFGGGMPVDIVTRNNVTENENSVYTTSSLTLLSVNPNDTANYICNASNFLGSETERASVEVLGMFHIIIS